MVSIPSKLSYSNGLPTLTPLNSRESTAVPLTSDDRRRYLQLSSDITTIPYRMVPESERVNKWP